MRGLWALAGLATSAACAAPLHNMPSHPSNVALQDLLNEAISDNEDFGGGVMRLVSADGSVLWEGAAGKRRGPGGDPMTPDATFDIASITKTFTAVVIMQLVEEGRLSLDDSITAKLPGPLTARLSVIDGNDVTPRITLAHLLQHRSGLPDYWKDPPFVEGDNNAFLRAFVADPNRLWRPEELLEAARRLAPVGMPGEKFHYCDTGYVLLGLVIETTCGRPLAEVFRSRIFEPLEMRDTFLPFVPPDTRRLPDAYRFEDDLPVSTELRQSADWGGGGLVSSTGDLARFIMALWHGTLFHAPQTLARMQSFLPTGGTDVDYGFGLFRITVGEHQGTLWGHDGHGNAFMYIWPEGNMAFVGTLNQVDNDWWPLLWETIQLMAGRG